MEFNAHNAKIELVRMANAGMLTTEEMCNAWNLVDDAEQDLADEADTAERRMAAVVAEREFRMFCDGGPGVRAADVLAKMGAVNDGSAKFWKRATACARLARTVWLAA